MIREATDNDTDKIIKIWLESSCQAHNFIPSEYWESRAQDVKEIYMPQAETYVLEIEGVLVGFISLVADYIAALFISPKRQKAGYGGDLMAFAKKRSKRLYLGVYKENVNAVSFYKKHGFIVSEERIEEETNHMEFVMNWHDA